MVSTDARAWAVVYLKGVCMGAADTVPGVSGGTIALITGIYERLVTALAAVDPASLRHAVRPHDAEARHAIRASLVEMDAGFLLVLALGIGTAVVGLSGLVAASLVAFRAPTNAFFFGLIAASAVVLYGELRLDGPRRVAAAIAAAVSAFLVSGLSAEGALPHGPAVVFAAGAVASAAMLLPGISGAAILYLLGQYEFLIGVLHGFLGAVPAALAGQLGALVEPGTVVATFLAGILVGLLTIAHAVRWALSADRATTMTVLVSLMVGALRLPVEIVLDTVPRWTPSAATGVVLAAVTGAAIVLVLHRYVGSPVD